MTNVELNETVKIVNNIENLAEIALGAVNYQHRSTSNQKYIRLRLFVNRLLIFPEEATKTSSHKSGF